MAASSGGGFGSGGKKTLTASGAFSLMSADQRLHLRKKTEPIIAEDGDYGAAVHGFSDVEVDTTAQMKREASSRGFANMSRLAGYSDTDLDTEIGALQDLAKNQHAVIEHHYPGSGLADEFAKRGEMLAAGASAERYRTSKSATYDSAAGDEVEAAGYDEFAQTSIVASRAGGRRAALNALKGSVSDDTFGKLDHIHRLMSVTSSYVRGDTAGIASEHDDDPDMTRTQHPTSSAMRATGGGGNSSYAHRMRTGIMQHVESAYVAQVKATHGFEPLMADRQRARLDAATIATTHMFNSPPTDHTLSAMGKEVPAKLPAISGTREVAKDMREHGLAPAGIPPRLDGKRTSMLEPPPSPRRSRDK